ncbi:MAG: hypothetical protein ABSD28_03830 [Tepidisphaeraceae bacterium]|jgi:hypothetical protein
MSLVIPISPQVESKIRERAAAEGKEPTAYAAKLLEQAVSRLSLDEILAPLRQEFAACGTSDEQLLQQITEARDAYRKTP